MGALSAVRRATYRRYDGRARSVWPAIWVALGLFLPRAVVAASAAPSCPPTAIVAGADPLVPSVVEILRQHGVAARPRPCGGRLVRVSLTARPNAGLHVLRIDDGFGRTSERTIADARTAASLIESWVLDEDVSLLSPKSKPAPDAPTTNEDSPVVTVPLTLTDTASSVFAATTSSSPTWRASAGAALSSDPDGHAAYGAAVTACGHVADLCVGARARFARASEATTLPDYDITRTMVDALAIASWPLTWQRATFTPLLGLGMGRARASALPDPLTVTRQDFSAIAEGAAIAGLRLLPHWSVVVEAAASISRRLSADPSDAIAARVPTQQTFLMRAAMGIEYAR